MPLFNVAAWRDGVLAVACVMTMMVTVLLTCRYFGML